MIENINLDLAQEVSNWTAREGLNRFVFNDGELVTNHADITTIKEINENGKIKYYAISPNNIPQEVFTDLIYKKNKLSKSRNKYFKVVDGWKKEKEKSMKRFVDLNGTDINRNDSNIEVVGAGKRGY